MSIEVVSFHCIEPENISTAAYYQYGVISRNRDHLNRSGIRTHSNFDGYLDDIRTSIDGKPVGKSIDYDLYTDYLSIRLGGIVVGGIDVNYVIEEPELRTIGAYYTDVDGGRSGKGHATAGIKLVIDRMLQDPDIDIVDAYVDPANSSSIRTLTKVGFLFDKKHSKRLDYMRFKLIL